MRLLKIITTLFAFSMVTAPAHAASVLNEILSDGVLKVGTTGDWNPMTMKDTATNSYTGYDIDVMTELAKDLGVKVEFVPTDWKTLVSGVTSGKYHMTGSASISPSRAKAAGYSNSYFSLATVPLTLKKNADKFTDWADLDKASVTVAATLANTLKKANSMVTNTMRVCFPTRARDRVWVFTRPPGIRNIMASFIALASSLTLVEVIVFTSQGDKK